MRSRKIGKVNNARLQEWLSAGLVVALSTLYLLWPAGGYQVINLWKYRLFLVLALLYVGVSLLIRAELWLISPHHRPLAWPRVALRPAHLALLYLLFTGISTLLSEFPGAFRGYGRDEGFFTIALYVGLFFLLQRHFRPKGWMLPVFAVSMTLFCLLGLVQLTGANPLGLYPAGYNFYGANIYYPGQYWSTIGNMNLCAALLSLASGLFAAACIRGRRARDWIFLVPLCLSVFSILALDSEAGLVALLGGLLLLPPFVVRTGAHLRNLLLTYAAVLFSASASKAVTFFDGGVTLTPGRSALALGIPAALLLLLGLTLGRRWSGAGFSPGRLRKWLAVASLAAVLAGFLTVYLSPFLPEGFLSQAHQLLRGHWDDSFGSGRLHIWRQTWNAIREKPLWGGGPDTLGLRGLEGFSRYNETLGRVVTSNIDVAHNEYLNIWVNQGLLALLAYLAFLAGACVRWWKQADDQAALAGAGVLFYGIQAFFGVSSCMTAPYFWVALAILLNQNRKEDDT